MVKTLREQIFEEKRKEQKRRNYAKRRELKKLAPIIDSVVKKFLKVITARNYVQSLEKDILRRAKEDLSARAYTISTFVRIKASLDFYEGGDEITVVYIPEFKYALDKELSIWLKTINRFDAIDISVTDVSHVTASEPSPWNYDPMCHIYKIRFTVSLV